VRKASEQTLDGAVFYNMTPMGHCVTRKIPTRTLPTAWNATRTRSLRLTWQISPKNKLACSIRTASQQRAVYGYSLGQRPAQARGDILLERSATDVPSQAGWKSPITGKIMLEPA